MFVHGFSIYCTGVFIKTILHVANFFGFISLSDNPRWKRTVLLFGTDTYSSLKSSAFIQNLSTNSFSTFTLSDDVHLLASSKEYNPAFFLCHAYPHPLAPQNVRAASPLLVCLRLTI